MRSRVGFYARGRATADRHREAETHGQVREPCSSTPARSKGAGPKRFAKAQQIVAAETCEILAVYGLLGAYDLVSVVECPDNRAAVKIAAKIGNLIGAKSETMPAIERDDFFQLLTEL
ncbi:MAG: GYD domain-containing protein [Acidimicrobiia bacterium]